MALKDSSGRITIDEHAAQQDINKLHQAIQHLQNSQRAIENIINQAATEQGQTASAILEKAAELSKRINAMIRNLNETSSFISHTVAHYQEVDRLLKEAIQNAASSISTPTVPKPSLPNPTVSVPTPPKPATPKPSTSKPSSSGNKKKKDLGDLVDDVADVITDAFKKFF